MSLLLPSSPFIAPWILPRWSGWSDGKGHPKVRVDGKPIYLHRLSWEKFNGREFPCGMHGDHLCRNRPCFNPMHIEPVPPVENHRRGNGPTTQFKPITPPDDSHITAEDIAGFNGDY